MVLKVPSWKEILYSKKDILYTNHIKKIGMEVYYGNNKSR